MIVGITGKKTSGKDTCADLLCLHRGAIKLSFADPLKRCCQDIFGLTVDQLHGSMKETPDPRWFGLTPRKIMQFVGTELFRNHMKELNENFERSMWVICMENRINEIVRGEGPENIRQEYEKNRMIVIPDVRFHDELESIKKLGGIIVRITRPCLESGDGASADLHASELNCSEFQVDYEIENSGTIEELYQKISMIV